MPWHEIAAEIVLIGADPAPNSNHLSRQEEEEGDMGPHIWCVSAEIFVPLGHKTNG